MLFCTVSSPVTFDPNGVFSVRAGFVQTFCVNSEMVPAYHQFLKHSEQQPCHDHSPQFELQQVVFITSSSLNMESSL